MEKIGNPSKYKLTRYSELGEYPRCAVELVKTSISTFFVAQTLILKWKERK